MDDRSTMREMYRSIVVAWVIAMTWTIALQRPWIALSITFGTLLGTGMLVSLDCVIRRAVFPGADRPMRALLKLGLVKYPLLGTAVIALARWDRISLLALCGGVVLVHFAIVAKTIGFMFVERLETQKSSAPSRAGIEGREN